MSPCPLPMPGECQGLCAKPWPLPTSHAAVPEDYGFLEGLLRGFNYLPRSDTKAPVPAASGRSRPSRREDSLLGKALGVLQGE